MIAFSNYFTWKIFYLTTTSIMAINPTCLLQNEIPKTVGEPLFMGDDSSVPYQFYVFDSNNRTVKYFDDQIYKIRLNGTKFFKRFLIQSRVATDSGQILDGTAGEFIPDRQWKRQGIKILDCPYVANDAITHDSDHKKFVVEAKWIAKRNDTPIQIFISVQQEPHYRWLHLAPKSGFLFPYVPTVDNVVVTDNTITSPDICNDEKKCGGNKTNDQRSEALREPSAKFLAPTKTNFFHSKSDKDETVFRNGTKIDGKFVDYCGSKPCLDGGICVNVPEEFTFECYCTDEWFGESCLTPNYCVSHPCRNWGTCKNNEFGFTCECLLGFGGKFCEAACPASFCKNGGTCTLNGDLQYACLCPPEYNGEFCQNEINFCTSNPCHNGGTCYDNPDNFECECAKGFMGERCHRPCQDVLLGCDFYDEQDLCDSPNVNLTKYYQINCAATCGKCLTYLPNVKTLSPVPPALEPLKNLLGTWRMEVESPMTRFPVSFPDAGDGYFEKLEIFRPFITPDDIPSLSFRTKAYNRHYAWDIAINTGFIYMKTLQDVTLIAVTTVGNDGLTVVEEGKMNGNERFELSSRYFHVHPEMPGKIPMKMKRRFLWSASRLQINVEKLLFGGRFENVTIVFVKETPVILY